VFLDEVIGLLTSRVAIINGFSLVKFNQSHSIDLEI
jgi:hypothetical protein